MSQLPLHPEAGTYRGWRKAVESMQAWIGTFEEFRWEAGDFIDAGDRVVVVIRDSFRDGKIVRLQWFDDKAAALEAAGLSE